jgi:hypothetical protein
MKVKLIKTDPESYHMGHYFLNDENKLAIGSTDYEWCRRVCSIKPQYKLSKKNCDDMFGAVDIDKLAIEFIQSLQQPNEIDVEVEMEDIYIYEPGDSNIFGNYSKLPNPKAGLPKIDSEGCLILKKI